MTGKTTQELAAGYALRMVLASGEDDTAEYQRITREVDRSRNKKLAMYTIAALTSVAVNGFRTAYPETWGAELRLSLHDLDVDPTHWTTDQPVSKEGKE
ncbi:hypothetical protein [Pseudarthrobacter sp. DSP2-3-2b1]|uniref:hypothetical protein n=1 Tax=Pseudarthrobacter sp. DSP2-3-2b1 TaxID=2804661 RepID=UPI003CFA5910